MNNDNLVRFLAERRPLTDEEIAELWPGSVPWSTVFVFARRIERAHGIYLDEKTMLGMQTDVC